MRTGLLLLLAILLTACRSSRETTTTVRSESAANRSAIEKNGHSDGNIETTALAERLVKKVNDNRLKKETVIADTKVTLSGFSGKNLSVSGKLRMKRNDCVQLSLRVFGIEMGIMEFTPEEVLIVDRPNKQYVRGRYDEIEFLRAAKLDFYSLQALFWNEIFIPGEKDASPSARHFTVRKEDGRLTLFPKDSETLRYGFSVTEKEGHLDQLTVTPASGGGVGTKFFCRYADFIPYDTHSFPTQIELNLVSPRTSFGLSLRLSSLKSEEGRVTRTTVSEKYRRRSVEEILKGLHL